MNTRALRYFRVLEITICTILALPGLLALATGHVAGGVALLGFSAFAALMFELRLRGHRETVARVWQGLSQVGERDLDAPAAVVVRAHDELVEEVAANRALARMMARRSTRLCVQGTWRGRPLEIGTAIVAGRDFDQEISYVCARDAALRGSFRAMTRGALTSFSRLGMATTPVATGDVAFDAKWVVDADERLCRTVLDAEIRSRLLALQAELAWLEVASVEKTPFGVVMRWPGELTPASAAVLRDVVLSVHDRLARGA